MSFVILNLLSEPWNKAISYLTIRLRRLKCVVFLTIHWMLWKDNCKMVGTVSTKVCEANEYLRCFWKIIIIEGVDRMYYTHIC